MYINLIIIIINKLDPKVIEITANKYVAGQLALTWILLF